MSVPLTNFDELTGSFNVGGDHVEATVELCNLTQWVTQGQCYSGPLIGVYIHCPNLGV